MCIRDRHYFKILLPRTRLYRERITQIEAKLEEVRSGKAHEYLQPLEELELSRKNRTEVASMMKMFRVDNNRHRFESEKKANKENFQVIVI